MKELKDIDFEIEKTSELANDEKRKSKNKAAITTSISLPIVFAFIYAGIGTDFSFDLSLIASTATYYYATGAVALASVSAGIVDVIINRFKGKNSKEKLKTLEDKLASEGILLAEHSLTESQAFVVGNNQKVQRDIIVGTEETIETITKEIYFLTKKKNEEKTSKTDIEIAVLRQFVEDIKTHPKKYQYKNYHTYLLEDEDRDLEEEPVRITLRKNNLC